MISIIIKSNNNSTFPKLLQSYTGAIVLFFENKTGIVLKSPKYYGRKRGDIGNNFDMNRFQYIKKITIKDKKLITKLLKLSF